jgi:hypothetical protein
VCYGRSVEFWYLWVADFIISVEGSVVFGFNVGKFVLIEFVILFSGLKESSYEPSVIRSCIR